MRLTTELYIKRLEERCPDKYSYELTLFVKSSEKLYVTCKKHNKVLYGLPHNFLTKANTCSECNKENMRSFFASNKEEFIKKSTTIHGDKYSYDKVNYINAKIKVDIYCNTHKEYFQQMPDSHVSGKGCIKCQHDKNRNSSKYNKEYFVTKAREVHGDKFNYDNSEYVNTVVKLNIYCNTCNTTFIQMPEKHLVGRGCPNCNNMIAGFRKSSWIKKGKDRKGVLYIIKVWDENESFLKVGITSVGIKKRFGGNNLVKIPYNYEVLKTVESDDLSYIWELEKRFKRRVNKRKYLPLKKFGGMTECFKQ